MNLTQAIERRVSRRTFLSTPIAVEKLEMLQKKMQAINETSGLKITYLGDGSTAFQGGKSYGMFDGVKALLILKGPATLPHLKEKVGYYGEQLVLMATALHLGTCWVGGTFDKALLQCPEEEEIVCVIPIGVVRERLGLKEKCIRTMIHRKTKAISEMIATDAPLSEKYNRAMALVQRAPTARNTQKVRFVFSNDQITAQVPDDYLFDLVDLGICKLHFECAVDGRFAWGNDGALQK